MKKQTLEPTDIHSGAIKHKVTVWPTKKAGVPDDFIAQEVAVALSYNGISHAVMMASPKDLEAFALGFSLTEGIVERAEEVYSIDIVSQAKGIEVELTIASRCFMQLKNRRRNLTGRTGCGICGAESLAQVRPKLTQVNGNFSVSHDAINRATLALSKYQPLQALTGAFHGAAWCDIDGNIVTVCEDVGRHNALDKLIGMLWPTKEQNTCVFKQPGFLLMSSRASYEIVQKAAKSGISVVAAVSAPTSLAIDIAGDVGMTLIGFARENRHVAYTHDYRLVEQG